MSRREGHWWRWATASCLIAALALGLGFILRAHGLSDAANTAQIVSLVPIVFGIVSWARIRHSARVSHESPSISLGEILLHTIADAQGLTGRDLRQLLYRWDGDDVDAYLNGEKHPDWRFVTDFLNIIAPKEEWRRELLERRVRPVWDAATKSGTSGDVIAVHSDSSVVVTPETAHWVIVLAEVGTTKQLVKVLQSSVIRHNGYRRALTELLEHLSLAVATLTAERDSLRERLAVTQGGSQIRETNPAPTSELEDLRDQLRDTQNRLRHAEQIQIAMNLRLEQSEQQRRLAERLRDEAILRAEHARHKLAELENNPESPIPLAIDLSSVGENAAYTLMGDTDQHVANEALRRVDGVLHNEAEALSQLGEELTNIGSPDASDNEDEQRDTGTDSGFRRIKFPLPKILLSGAFAIFALTAIIVTISYYTGYHKGHNSSKAKTSPSPSSSLHADLVYGRAAKQTDIEAPGIQVPPSSHFGLSIGTHELTITANNWNTIVGTSHVAKLVGVTFAPGLTVTSITHNRFQYLADEIALYDKGANVFDPLSVVPSTSQNKFVDIAALYNPTNHAGRLSGITVTVSDLQSGSTLASWGFFRLQSHRY